MRRTAFRAALSTLAVFAIAAATMLAQEPKPAYPDGMYAELSTNKGVIVLALEFQKTPMTVASFVGLAEGTIENKALPPGTPFFDGTVFHRVVPGHVIQAGQAARATQTSPGYTFPNEIAPGLDHGRAGMLGMANSGPNTNGSQFYITLANRSYLDGNYTVFGHVVSGMDVVTSIVQGDRVDRVRIIRVGEAAKAFKADTATFRALADAAWARVKAADEKKASDEAAAIAKGWPNAKTSPKGVRYVIDRTGTGEPAQTGQTITVRYTGRYLLGSRSFASTADEGRPAPDVAAQPFDFVMGKTRVTAAVDEALLDMRKGERRTIVALGPQAYGNSGFYSREKPGEKRFVIPPQTALVYEVEVLEIR